MCALTKFVSWSIGAAIAASHVSWADGETVTFRTGRFEFEMEFVTIGDPGNTSDEPDHTGLTMGAVDYVYQIGKFEVACEALSIFQGSGTSACPDGRSVPAAQNWVGMAEFVNWLNELEGHSPAYKIERFRDGRVLTPPWNPGEPGYDANNPMRNSLARYVIPTADEWHKAAYYDPLLGIYYDYATASNMLPISSQTVTTNQDEAVYFDGGARIDHGLDVTQVGGLSPFGTMGQTGNAPEWEEGIFFGNARATRSGGEHGVDLLSAGNSRVFPNLAGGLRVVRLVPEPTSHLLCCVSFLGLFAFRRD